MRTIRQPDDAFVYTLSAVHPPIASVACNETVVIETIDAFEGKLRSSSDLYLHNCPAHQANPQTGSISLEGAKPGDTLVESTRII